MLGFKKEAKEELGNDKIDPAQIRHLKQWMNLNSIIFSIDRWEGFLKDFQDSKNEAL